MIRKQFGVVYHPAHVSRLLKALRLSLQKARAPGEPEGRGGHKTLERGTLARTEKGALEEVRTILLADQSGFYLLPTVVRTYPR